MMVNLMAKQKLSSRIKLSSKLLIINHYKDDNLVAY